PGQPLTSGPNCPSDRCFLGRSAVFRPIGGPSRRGRLAAGHRRQPRPSAFGRPETRSSKTPSYRWLSGFHFVPERCLGPVASSELAEIPHSGPGPAPARGNRSLVGRTVRPIGVFLFPFPSFVRSVGHPVGGGWQRGTGGSPGRGRAARPETRSSK